MALATKPLPFAPCEPTEARRGHRGAVPLPGPSRHTKPQNRDIMMKTKPPYHENGMRYGWSGSGERICTGAMLGRPTIHPDEYQGERLNLRRVPIDSGGYDPGGAYWGHGTPLYCAYGHGWEAYTRAPSRKEAKRILTDELARYGDPPTWKR